MAKKRSTDERRCSFNSGFHDGRDDRAKGRPLRVSGRTTIGTLGPLPAWDPEYRAGYESGSTLSVEFAADPNLTSDSAWRAHLEVREIEARERKQLRDMRPDPWKVRA